MNPFRSCSVLLALSVTSVSLGSQSVTHIEDFETGNPSNWAFMPPDATTFIAGTGGNPGRYLTHTQTQWVWPTVWTGSPGSIFTGDYRALNATSLGLDMIVTLTNAQQHPDFTVSVMLVHKNGTPGTADDTRIYFNSGQSIPWPGQGWKSYDFAVPSQDDPPFPTLPPGWKYWEDQFGTSYKNHSWREVMENVDEIWFVGINDPAGFGFLLNWISGVDNMRLTYEKEEEQLGDLNGDGVVNVFDLLILLAEWGPCDDPQDCPADLNDDGVVNVFDLLVLLANWG